MARIWAIAIGGAVVIMAFLTFTGTGHVIDLAVQHFMLFYAGVFALIGLCASVGAGLVATDRMVLNPGHRVWLQSAHRAISFGALAFLIVHIVTEILAQRSHVIDAVVPFLSPFRTFYIGLGTIASDLIILLVITGILRKRFTGNGKNVWRWRAIHYTSYAAFVFGVWHGLLAGRPGKPYVDWSYGFIVAFVALGLAVRVLANSLRPKESLSAPPVAESAGSGSAPLRAAAMLAQVGMTRAAMPAMTGAGRTETMLPAAGAPSGPMRAIPALPASSVPDGAAFQGAPVYEPGYDGPPRYQGAPRPVSGPMPQVPGGMSGGQQRPVPQGAGAPSGGFARPATGPVPQGASGVMPWAPGPPSGGFAGPPSGGFARPVSGPMPQVPGGMSGGQQRPVPQGAGAPSGGFAGPATAPMPQPMTGPVPLPGYGDVPQWDMSGQDGGYGFRGGDELR